MKRLIYILLSVSCFMLLVSCQGIFQSSSPELNPIPPLLEQIPSAQAPQPPHPIPALPPVSTDHLNQHLDAIATERYSASQRQEARNYIKSILEENGWQIEEQDFSEGINIIAHRPDQAIHQREILIGAHYDSVRGTPGADDNATGVAAALELSSIFQDIAGPRNLVFAFFDLEEKGALGSTDYVNQPQNLDKLEGAIILEMLGYTCHTPQCQGIPPELDVTPPSDKGDFLSIIGDTEHPVLLNAFRDVSSPLQLFSLDVPFKGLLSPILLRSDHAPFWLKGKGAVMVSDTAFLRNPHYHRTTDTIDTLDLTFLSQSTEFVAQATATLLQSPNT